MVLVEKWRTKAKKKVVIHFYSAYKDPNLMAYNSKSPCGRPYPHGYFVHLWDRVTCDRCLERKEKVLSLSASGAQNPAE